MEFDRKLAAYQKDRELFAVANLQAGLGLLTIGGAACALENSTETTPVHWVDDVFFYDDVPSLRIIIQVNTSSVIGLCQFTHSERHVWHTHDPADGDHLLGPMPQRLRSEAQRMAARYLQAELEEGVDVPCITAAFWSTDNWWLTAAEPWQNVFLHGAEAVLRPALMRLDRAIPEAQKVLSLSNRQMEAVQSLYERRMAAGNARLAVSIDELRDLYSETPSGADVGLEFLREQFALSDSEAEEFESLPPFTPGSLAACRELLAVVGIDMT